MSIRDDIVEQARSYLGVKWVHQGRTRAGMDCAGLIIAVAHELSLHYVDDIGYSRTPDGNRLRDMLNANAVRKTDAETGDIILMRFQTEPQHLAIKTPIGVIHSYMAVRKVVEHSIDETWSRRIVAVYSFKGV